MHIFSNIYNILTTTNKNRYNYFVVILNCVRCDVFREKKDMFFLFSDGAEIYEHSTAHRTRGGGTKKNKSETLHYNMQCKCKHI